MKLKDELTKFDPKGNRILQITGVGDHGGGPTRANIEMVRKSVTYRTIAESIGVCLSTVPQYIGNLRFNMYIIVNIFSITKVNILQKPD